ncbi:MAG TPA: hypothetical protein DD670_01220 [Planctomycetaceae bacterium]|nr:hypothetical protein [Planctomycetaceae bacterium]
MLALAGAAQAELGRAQVEQGRVAKRMFGVLLNDSIQRGERLVVLFRLEIADAQIQRGDRNVGMLRVSFQEIIPRRHGQLELVAALQFGRRAILLVARRRRILGRQLAANERQQNDDERRRRATRSPLAS